MSDLSYTFKAKLWLYAGKSAWHFVTVPNDISAQITHFTERRGLGSVRVTAEINGRNWKTSIFPDAKSGCYFLPVKAEVRTGLGLVVGDDIAVTLNVDING